MTHEGKEGRNGEGLVGLTDDLVVYGMPVEPEGEEGGCRVYGYHEENSNDAISG